MSFKMSKEEKKERNILAGDLNTLREKVVEAIENYNHAMSSEFEKVSEMLDEYNEKIEEARDWLEGFHSRLEEEYSDRSEKWQEGDRGQVVMEWMDEISMTSECLSQIELDEPEPYSAEIDDFSTTLESDISEEPNY